MTPRTLGTPEATDRRNRGASRLRGAAVAAAIFLLSLAAARSVGFRMRIPYEFYQLMDARLLLEHPLESLGLLHGQPPGLNLLFFLVLWTAEHLGAEPESVAAVLFAAIGLGTCLLLSDIVLDLTGSSKLAAVAVALLAAGPGFHVYGNLFFYPFPLQLLLLLVLWLALRWLRCGGTGRLVAVVAALAAVCLTRTLYHPVWALGGFALLAAMRGRRTGEGRGLAVGAAVLVAMLAAWPAKNALVFGRFLYSSWDGLNLHATLPIPGNDDLASVLRGGPVSEGMRRELEERTRGRSEVGKRLLLDPKKSDGSPNWNHLVFLLTDRDLARRAIAWRLEHPGAWLAKAVAQYLMWARPTWWQPYRQEDLGPESAAYRAWSAAWRAVGFADLRPAVEAVLPVEAVHREAHVRGRPVPYTLFGVVLLPAVLVAAIGLSLGPLRRRRPEAAVVALATATVLWNLAVPAATYGQEGNRMRVSVVPLLLLLGAWSVRELWLRRSSGRASA